MFPLKIRFGEDEYLDGVTLSPSAFYEKMSETGELPKTSQIPPYEYAQAFQTAVGEGDEVLCLCISSGVSGSYQSACMAAEEFADRVAVVDTRQFCASEYVIVHRAVQLRDQGLSLREMETAIRGELAEAHVMAVFDTLEYLRLGGRISSAAAIAGRLLSIKPVLTIENGVVRVLAKARGTHACNRMLTEWIRRTGPIDFDRPVCLAYSGVSDRQLRQYLEESDGLFEGHEDRLQETIAGATIGTYAGPGAIAFAFFTRKESKTV